MRSELCRARMEKEIEKGLRRQGKKGDAEGEGERSLRKILKRRFQTEGPETWEPKESALKKEETQDYK